MEVKEQILKWFGQDSRIIAKLSTELDDLPNAPTVLVTVEGGIASIERFSKDDPETDQNLAKINILIVDVDVDAIDDEARITDRYDAIV